MTQTITHDKFEPEIEDLVVLDGQEGVIVGAHDQKRIRVLLGPIDDPTLEWFMLEELKCQMLSITNDNRHVWCLEKLS